MPGNPHECRKHAQTLRLAAEAHNPQAKETFESLAETWLRLAADRVNPSSRSQIASSSLVIVVNIVCG
jgi:hypothetical protein